MAGAGEGRKVGLVNTEKVTDGGPAGDGADGGRVWRNSAGGGTEKKLQEDLPWACTLEARGGGLRGGRPSFATQIRCGGFLGEATCRSHM